MSDRSSALAPRFSVVIPTCRRNDALARCLNRLMPGEQTLPAEDYEVIVSDDGPDANDARLLVEHTYPWARWVQGPKHGPGQNRNHGAKQARGEWLVFTDDDCLPEPGWLAGYAARIDERATGSSCPRVFEGKTVSDTGGQPMDLRFTAPTNEEGGLLWSCNFAIERTAFSGDGRVRRGVSVSLLRSWKTWTCACAWTTGARNTRSSSAAVVDHPPRPVGPLLNTVRSQEAAWYLAKKRGVKVAQIGPRPATYLRIYVHRLRRCRGGEGFSLGDVAFAGPAAYDVALSTILAVEVSAVEGVMLVVTQVKRVSFRL